MKIDPYLQNGITPCYVWDNGWSEEKERIGIFTLYINEKPFFRMPKSIINLSFDNYRPINTEWDYAPEWAFDPKNKDVCSTVDKDGTLRIWNTSDITPVEQIPAGGKKDSWWWNHMIATVFIVCGICPDKFRYEKDAWKTSRRTRPEWASDK